jgi:hypothetical protein
LAFEGKSKCEQAAIFTHNGKWFGHNPGSDHVWELAVLKEDQNILVLDNPVFFSGQSVIYLMQPAHRFSWLICPLLHARQVGNRAVNIENLQGSEDMGGDLRILCHIAPPTQGGE